jgi:hypothetical protein
LRFNANEIVGYASEELRIRIEYQSDLPFVVSTPCASLSCPRCNKTSLVSGGLGGVDAHECSSCTGLLIDKQHVMEVRPQFESAIARTVETERSVVSRLPEFEQQVADDFDSALDGLDDLF